jgi:putative ABC transport system permease protein
LSAICLNRRGIVLKDFFHDLRHGFRMLRKNPGFASIAIVTLGLGIGANTVVFSAVNTLLLRPLPGVSLDRVVFGFALREGFDPFGASLLEYGAYRDQSQSFETSGVAGQRSLNLVQRGEPRPMQGAALFGEYLATLGVKPIIGRGFTAEEERPGGPPAALIGYGMWQTRFAGDSNVIGQTLDLDGRIYTVVGVMPAGFDLPAAAEIWIPLQVVIESLPLTDRASTSYEIVARLKPGVRLEQADAELKAIARQLENEYPQIRKGWSVQLVWLRRELLADLSGNINRALSVLLASVGFLLLICCANVASLQLARGVVREREIAIRKALGASAGRVARQLLTESMLLAGLGGALGLLLAYEVAPVLSSLSPIRSIAFAGFLRDFRIDARVLMFTLAVSLFTGVAFGVIPTLKTLRLNDLMSLIRRGDQRSGKGLSGRKLLGALVVLETAMAVTLLIAGALLVRSFQQLQRIDLGFQPDHLLTLQTVLSPARYPTHQQRAAFVDQVLSRIKELPGVVSAGTTTNIPLTRQIAYDSPFAVEGRPPADPNQVPITSHRLVSPDYLKTIGVTLVKGRSIDEHDTTSGAPVAVISEALARQGWPGEDPIGKRLRRGRPQQTQFPWMTVVGVVKDVREDLANFRIKRPVWYLPYAQVENLLPVNLVIKTGEDPALLTPAILEAVRSVDSLQPISNVMTMDENLGGVLVTERFSAILMGMLAGLGLMLATLGLYGVMAYTASQRTAEMGLRLALGAQPRDVFKLMLVRGIGLTSLGLGLGLAGALGATRLLSGVLYGISPQDPLTFVLVSMLIAGVATAASYVPARRAARVEPVEALRYE